MVKRHNSNEGGRLMARFVDFAAIRRFVSMEQVLGHYGVLEGMTRNGPKFTGPCPVHRGSNKSQFTANRNKWHCFGDCTSRADLHNGGGNCIDFVRVVEGIDSGDAGRDTYEAALRMIDWFNLKHVFNDTGDGTAATGDHRSAAPAPATAVEKADDREPEEEAETLAPNEPLKFSLENLETGHPYFAERRLTPETISHFGLGYLPATRKGMMSGRIVIPIHSASGELLAYCGRWPGDADIPEGAGKYQLPPRDHFRPSLEVFNMHRVRTSVRHGILVEGYFDAFWLTQQGFPNVVTVFGSSLSAQQVDILAVRFRSVQIFLDGNETGRKASLAMVRQLVDRLWVKVVWCPSDAEPEHLTKAQLEQLLR